MPRIYSVSFAATVTSAGGDTDLFEFVPGDDHPIRLRGLKLGQTSDVGDAASEGVRISIIRLPATFTSSNGTSTTPRPLDVTTPAATFGAEVNGTTVATTSGTAITLEEFGWLIQASPYETWWPDADFAPTARQTEGLVVRLQTTLADDISMACTAYIEED